MNFGFISLHPITMPLGNELAHVVGNVYAYGCMLYVGTIKPELLEIMEVINSL